MLPIAERSELRRSARDKRALAQRCRDAVREGASSDATSLLTQYAMELEERAEMLDTLAADGRARKGKSAPRPLRDGHH